MRKTIARRLTESKQTVPHFYLSLDCDMTQLNAARERINKAAENAVKGQKDAKPAYKLSVNDMIIKAVAMSLREIPAANASWTDNAIRQYNNVDISVAVAMEGGLITPIVKNADQKSLAQISAEAKDLINRARSGKLQPEEYQGGTTAVSNLGMFGVKDFTAVINPPHGAILAVGAGLKKPVVVMTGDLHNSFAVKVTDRVWEFCSGPHNSANHPARSEGDRLANGPFDSRGTKCDIRWSSFFRNDVPGPLRRWPIYAVAQHGGGQAPDIVHGDMGAALDQGAGLGAEDEELAGAGARRM